MSTPSTTRGARRIQLEQELAAQDETWARTREELTSLGDVQLAFESPPELAPRASGPAIVTGLRG